MHVNEIIKPVEEGVNDPHIFKAVFLAGGPGSGKSFVANKMLKGSGLRTVNSDDIYEYLMKKKDMDMSDPSVIASPQGQETRNKAKELTNKRQGDIITGKGGYIEGRLGLIIDGTGKDVAKVAKATEQLKNLGYDTMMLFVNTSEEVAQERNMKRDRSIPSVLVSNMWKQVQNNLMKFQQVFGAANFHVVDNSGGLEDPDRKANFLEVDRAIDKFLMSTPSDRRAKAWIQDQKSK
ncbi:zeta toxin family protein [bacterium]|nr:zeta toxin family protein [bacterium]